MTLQLRKDRIRWQDDSNFSAFNKILYETFWNFEEALEFSTLKELEFEDLDLIQMKELWLTKIKRWNELEIKEKPNSKFIPDSEDKIIGFAALNFLIVVLPYEKLKRPEIFTEFYINQINLVRCYFHGPKATSWYKDLNFTGVIPVIEQGPILPGAFREWFDEKINSSTWWITYFLYERKNNLDPWIISPPTRRL